MPAPADRRSRPSGPNEPELSAGEIRDRAAQAVVLVALRGLGIRAIGLAGYLALARLLEPGEFGVAAFGLSIAFLSHFLADVGIGPALIRRPEAPTRADYASVVGLQLAVTGATAAAAGAWWVATGSRTAGVTALFLASLPFFALRLPAAISLERQLRYRPVIAAELSEVLAYNVWAIGTVLGGWGVYGMASAAVVKSLVGTVVLASVGPNGWVRPALDLSRIRALLPFGVAFQASSALSIIREQTINLGTAAISGYHVLGLWAVANRVTSVPLLLFESLWRVSFPVMARLLATGERAEEMMRRGVRTTGVVAGLLLAPLAVGAPGVLEALLGAKWHEAGKVIPMIFFGMTVGVPISVVAIGYLYARGEAGAVLRTNLGLTATALAIAFAGLPVVGYVALGWALLAAALVDAYLLARAVRRSAGIALGRAVLAPSAAWLIAFAAGAAVLLTDWPRLVAALVASFVSAAVYVLIIHRLDRDATVRAFAVLRRLAAEARRRQQPVPGAEAFPFTGVALRGDERM
jgi:O-antigen/teichoic acid export membrane protein